jgi:hypothetical protein
MEYHRTKDILHVMNFLGHKRIENTLKYTHMVNVEEDEYVSRVAKTTAEACALVDGGFEAGLFPELHGPERLILCVCAQEFPKQHQKRD